MILANASGKRNTLVKNKPAKGFRSVIGRTPAIKLAGNIVEPVFAATKQPPLTIPAGRFKATCLHLLDRSAQGEIITITKHGKVVARLVPPEPENEKPFRPLLGRLKGHITVHGDIVGPDFDAWKMRQ